MVDRHFVLALFEEKSLDPMDVAVLAKKHLSTIYRWRSVGIEYLDWVGLLTLLGEKPDWQPQPKK